MYNFKFTNHSQRASTVTTLLDNALATENALEVPVPSNRTFNYRSGISFIKSSYRQTVVSKLRGNDEKFPSR